MPWQTIDKPLASGGVQPNMRDYAQTCANFTWESARNCLDCLPSGLGLNISHEAVDRHASGVLAGHIALRWLGKTGTVRDITYEQLREQTNRFANILTQL